MVNKNAQSNDMFSANDPLDINELASLNDDITPEFIEQLQNQVAENASKFIGREVNLDDSQLFEETVASEEIQENSNSEPEDIIKIEESTTETVPSPEGNDDKTVDNLPEVENKEIPMKSPQEIATPVSVASNDEIQNLTNGNIVEKPITKEQIDYAESLDYLDENVKYSKYVIYVNPENVEFIESLTVKERKNLINRILKEQDDIITTKQKLNLIHTVIMHIIIAIITIALAIPIVYWTINASLEASINNHKRSQKIFNTLYRQKGKIKPQTKI